MNRVAAAWLVAFGLAGCALVGLYPDSYQQDAGHHFLKAQWAWNTPSHFVSVWGRPLFTTVYAVPALGGYVVAKLFTVVIALLTAWETWRLAKERGLARAELAIPLLFLQPSYLLLCSDTLTETLFALVFVVALRLHLKGRVTAGMLVASLMILVAPWGFFLGCLWGVWVLADGRRGGAWWRRLPSTLLLASGVALWWLAALAVTGDPAWIKHDWPPDWKTEGRYGTGAWWWYGRQLFMEILGPVLIVPFLAGIVASLRKRQLGLELSSVGVLLVLLAVMFTCGIFNAAGYARYLVCVAPALSILLLAGWNLLAESKPLAGAPAWVRIGSASAVLLLAAGVALFYVDGWGFGRDARAVAEMRDWFGKQSRPVSRLAWSQAYMCIAFNRNPAERPAFTGDRQANLAQLRECPSGTLVFWDRDTGPSWHGVTPADLEAIGYSRLRSQSYVLEGRFFRTPRLGHGGVRTQEMHLFYKE
jgi:hypothetical protein